MLVLAFHWSNKAVGTGALGWLRSFGRLSYEIYLTHMFVVYSIVQVFGATGGNKWRGWLWYVPTVGLSWVLGWLVARYISGPSERAVRGRLLGQRNERSLRASGQAGCSVTQP
jgi:peptidoglycan/LPS O-acetylase OafA/YrhL